MGLLDDKQRQSLFACSVFFNLVVFGLSIYIAIATKQANELSSIDFTNIEQLVSDWDTVPFVNVTVQTVPCYSASETIFENNWGGLVRGCMVTSYYHAPFVTTESDYDLHYQSDDSDYDSDTYFCSSIPSMSAVTQSNSFG